MARDDIYALRRDHVGRFEFDDQVADVFPDMIARSVPGYGSILSVIEQLAVRFVRERTNVYDLGCSLGAATKLIRRHAPPSATIHAIDSSSAMIERFRHAVEMEANQSSNACELKLHLADICDVEFANASLIVLNFTLQFVAEHHRERLLRRCADSMVPGGALLLSEKLAFEDKAAQQLLGELHLDFKRSCGYSEMEIAQKRSALEETLIPETLHQHCERLTAVGFDIVVPWFQCFNFASILAVRS